ncbi:MAG: ATP-dependent RecD-like DNA helicase [Myxococcota bacterium]|nr:ATP-dependent RecD-like DNA helicase [Myxococcota bacterium]
MKPTGGGPALTTVEGVLERVTFSNDENAWSVVQLEVQGRRDLVTCVGNLLGVQPGESLRLSGHWVTDKKYGEQFRVESYVTVEPATLVGIEKYLGSGLVRGVGKVMAERLVGHFGMETLEVIDQQPARLTEVDGIGPVRSERITKAWVEQRQIKDVMVFLQSHGVSTTYATRIYKQYRDRSIAVVRENPYRLATDIMGIGFKSADKIAERLGIGPTSPLRAEAGVLHVLATLSDEGHVYVPRPRLLSAAVEVLTIDPPIIETAIGALAADERVVIEPLPSGDEAVYLKPLHTAEAVSAGRIRMLLGSESRSIRIDIERAIAWFETQQDIQLADEQKEAIRKAATSKLLVVTGGPGTGKTTLVNGVIRILEKKARRILLAAPTGRAAKRMAETTGREAKTIHRLLEFNPKKFGFDRDASNPLEADLVILDEASMIDTVLAYHVLKALPLHCQLVLVGDIDQLPSVGPGSVLGEIIRSGVADVVRLRHIFRQGSESLIVVNAHRVNEGLMPELPSEGSKADFFFIERKEPEEIVATLKALVRHHIPHKFGLDPVTDIQVLTPMQRGLLGVAGINAELQTLLNPSGESLVRGNRSFRQGDKVMQVRNNYDLAVFNGDIGRIEKIDSTEQQVLVIFDGRTVTYDYGDLDELVLAYACSIHKSQGSEYPCVIIPLHTQHFVMLQRNLLYTGLTRGKRLVVLVGSKRALAIAVKNNSNEERCTMLADRLSNANRHQGVDGSDAIL